MPHLRRIAAIMAVSAAVSALGAPAQAATGAEMRPAVSINYTQKNINPGHIIKMLVAEVSKIDPNSTYDVVGYETTPKNDQSPVSNRVKEIQDMLVKNGVARDKTYVLVKPTDTPYQQIDIFVHN